MSETTYLVIYFIIFGLFMTIFVKIKELINKKKNYQNDTSNKQSFDRDFEITEADEDLSFFDDNEFTEETQTTQNDTEDQPLIKYPEIVEYIKDLSLESAENFKKHLNLDNQQSFLIEMEIFFYYSMLLILHNISKVEKNNETLVFFYIHESLKDYQEKSIQKKFVTKEDEIETVFKDRLKNYDKLKSVPKENFLEETIKYQIELISYIVRHRTFHYYNLFPKSITEYSEIETNMYNILQIKTLIDELLFGKNLNKLLKLFED